MASKISFAFLLLLLILTLTFLLFRFHSPSTLLVFPSTNSSLDSFHRCFRGHSSPLHDQLPSPIFIAGDASYHSILLSAVKNPRFLASPANSKPSLIVAAATESHAQAAVVCAGGSGLGIRVLSGGHDYEGMSYSAAGSGAASFITVDLSGLRSIAFDADGASAWVQAGATLGELYYAVAKQNGSAAFPAGFCPTVGVGGHFSGGGMGSLTRKFGTAADNIVDARMVDAEGRLLDREAMGEEMFWAIRGAGSAGFGVIVAFKIAVVRVPPAVTVFNVVRTLRQNATKLAARWQQLAHRLDRSLFIRLIAQAADEPDGTRTIQAIFSSLYLGRREELLAEAGRSIPELSLTAADCTEMSWLESVLFFMGNISFKAKSDFVKEPIAESGWKEIWKFLMEAAVEERLVLIVEPLGGKMSEIQEDAIAFPHRKQSLYNIQYFLKWVEKEEEEVTQRHLKWMKSLYEFMTPYVSSKPRAAYYNYKDIDLGRNVEGRGSSYLEARVWGTRYFKGHFLRLAKLKTLVDPQNIFWNELSIPPL
ncbi:hypothetical protein KSP39_PZI014549 [Platanthera zijinensis]|uniref:FAD-binding PCMH-type domain-containing protein n=1 Tax=Platanthera zijinensis TaxID=2320716 RepID=A0AAP0BAS3_9ASPA